MGQIHYSRETQKTGLTHRLYIKRFDQNNYHKYFDKRSVAQEPPHP